MRLFRRGPRFGDDALRDLAQEFVDSASTPGADALDRTKLDFSIQSLGRVDDYLEVVRSRELADKELVAVTYAAGAYLGEVVRRAATDRNRHWISYDDAKQLLGSKLGDRSLPVIWLLWAGPKDVALPFGKVVKFLQNGREDSVEWFAAVFAGVARPPDVSGLGAGVHFIPMPPPDDEEIRVT